MESADGETEYVFIRRPSGNELDMHEILVQSINTLKNIEIIEEKPTFVTGSAGELIVNVKGGILENSSTVSELLAKVPTIIVEDESISVFGKGEAIILINGKMISASQLRMIQVSQIESIEICKLLSFPQ